MINTNYHKASTRTQQSVWFVVVWGLKNLQGDVTAIYSIWGGVHMTYAYDAWGMPTVTSGNEGTQYVWLLGYRGYQYDKETGLNYCQSRYYNPRIARWLNADEIEIIKVLDGVILGANAFAYCEKNPVMNTDDTGEIVITTNIQVA